MSARSLYSGSIKLPSLDSLFSTEEERQEAKLEKVQNVPVSELYPFTNHPFQVRDDEEMQKFDFYDSKRGGQHFLLSLLSCLSAKTVGAVNAGRSLFILPLTSSTVFAICLLFYTCRFCGLVWRIYAIVQNENKIRCRRNGITFSSH